MPEKIHFIRHYTSNGLTSRLRCTVRVSRHVLVSVVRRWSPVSVMIAAGTTSWTTRILVRLRHHSKHRLVVCRQQLHFNGCFQVTMGWSGSLTKLRVYSHSTQNRSLRRCYPSQSLGQYWSSLVGCSLMSLFSTTTAISETKDSTKKQKSKNQKWPEKYKINLGYQNTIMHHKHKNTTT